MPEIKGNAKPGSLFQNLPLCRRNSATVTRPRRTIKGIEDNC